MCAAPCDLAVIGDDEDCMAGLSEASTRDQVFVRRGGEDHFDEFMAIGGFQSRFGPVEDQPDPRRPSDPRGSRAGDGLLIGLDSVESANARYQPFPLFAAPPAGPIAELPGSNVACSTL